MLTFHCLYHFRKGIKTHSWQSYQWLTIGCARTSARNSSNSRLYHELLSLCSTQWYVGGFGVQQMHPFSQNKFKLLATSSKQGSFLLPNVWTVLYAVT